MRAYFRHQDSAVPLALKSTTHPFLAQAVMIFPRIVEEVHAGIQGLIDNLGGFSVAVRRAEVVSANSQCRNLKTGAAQRSLGYFRAGLSLREACASQHKRLHKSSPGYIRSERHIISSA